MCLPKLQSRQWQRDKQAPMFPTRKLIICNSIWRSRLLKSECHQYTVHIRVGLMFRKVNMHLSTNTAQMSEALFGPYEIQPVAKYHRQAKLHLLWNLASWYLATDMAFGITRIAFGCCWIVFGWSWIVFGWSWIVLVWSWIVFGWSWIVFGWSIWLRLNSIWLKWIAFGWN